jgi:hypothetical protein
MEDLLKKISQYQLFNFLLSGAVLTVLLRQTTSINIIYDNAILEFFVFYAIGLVISRVGSLAVEPTLKKLKIIVFAPYADYLKAVKLDPKIDTLSQENNTYRTLIATSLTYLVIYSISKYATDFVTHHKTVVTYLFAVLLVLLFVLAYHKQTNYINKRINQANTK